MTSTTSALCQGPEVRICVKRDLLTWQKRPAYIADAAIQVVEGPDNFAETTTYMAEQTVKRDLLMWQKRPTYVAKETYL